MTVVTYHKAKGREWPVVVLSGLDFERDADLWSPEVTGGTPQKDDPLQGRVIRYWPWPFGRGLYNKLVQGSGLETDALTTDEGQHAQQRSEAERLRLLYVGFTRAKDKLILAHRDSNCQWLQMLPEIDTILDPKQEPGEHTLKDIQTTYVVRHLDEQLVAKHSQSAPTEERWLKQLSAPDATLPLVARYHSPSQAQSDGAPPTVQLEDLPGQSIFPHGYNDGHSGTSRKG